MSSSEDLFSDPDMDLEDLTPPSSLTSNSVKSSQQSQKSSQQPQKSSQQSLPVSRLSLNPAPDTNTVHKADTLDMISEEVYNEEFKKPITKLKIEFIDESEERTCVRFSTDPDTIDIITPILRSSDDSHRKSGSNKLLKSDEFGPLIVQTVLNNLSASFSDFLSSQDCPLRCKDLLSCDQKIDELDLNKLLEQCKASCPEVVEALTKILFGNCQESENQRLLTVIMIGAYTQNQQVNLVPRLVGEFLKRNNCSKRGLELLQKCGVTLLSKSVSRDQDKIGEQFLSDVKKRKDDIQVWNLQRKTLLKLVMKDQTGKLHKPLNRLEVTFVPDELSPQMCDLGNDTLEANVVGCEDSSEIAKNDHSEEELDLSVASDSYLTEILKQSESPQEALEKHLLNKPKCLAVSYDNIDGNSKSSDFIVGDESVNSYHWCSSVIFEDVVSANELSDKQIQPNIMEVTPDIRMSVTPAENEHLLQYYTQFVMHLIKTKWPNLFPTLQTSANIQHQYSKQFENGVNCWVGPLVFEDESSIDGISKVITTMIDEVCPKSVNVDGTDSPIHPTVFSGDNKTEKMARSAKLALAENGSMRERLGK